jgi:hypothetical protein
MRRTALSLLAVVAIAAIVWAGGEPWKTKPVSQWTEKDIQDVLQNSPWAKANVEVRGAWRPDGMSQASGSPTIPGSGQPSRNGSVGDNSHVSAGATPDTPGGLENAEAAAAAQVPYSVFWWSSRTVRAAFYRRAVLKGTMTEADLEEHVAASPDEYMVLVQSTNMRIFQLRGEKAFESAAYLQTRTHKQRFLQAMSRSSRDPTAKA